MDKRLAECQRVIGYHFANPKLLEIALTHSSLRTPDRECNERLEFLGDSVLGLVVTEELYKLLPDQAEGELTRIKSAVVSRGALYRASTNLGLARYAEFARGVGRRNELPVSVIANLVESVIGAIYLDAGYFPAREFVLRNLGDEMDDTLNDRGAKNHKSLLQHEVQQSVGATPVYRTVDEEGPHHRKQFTVTAMVRNQEWGRGSGQTKKEAEQEAARKALAAWQRRGRGRRRRRGRGAEGGRDDGRPEIAPRGAAAPPESREPRPSTRRRRPERSTSRPAAAVAESPAPEAPSESRRRRRRPRDRDPAPEDPVGGTDDAPPERKTRRRRAPKVEPTAEASPVPSDTGPSDTGPSDAGPSDAASAAESPWGGSDDAPTEAPAKRKRAARSSPRTRKPAAGRSEPATPDEPAVEAAPAEEAKAPAKPKRKAATRKRKAPAAEPADDGFAEGLDVKPAPRSPSRARKKTPSADEASRRVPARRKAPMQKPPSDDGGGFDDGLGL